MSLATRLSGFFLAALALVLAGFSVTLYLLAGAHFQRDMDERMTMGLDALLQSVVIDSDEVEWKPGARPTIPGEHPQDDPVRWAVYDDRGRVIDRCWNWAATTWRRSGPWPRTSATNTSSSPTARGNRGGWSSVASRPGNAADEEREESHGDAGEAGDAGAAAHGAASLILAAGTSAAPIEAGLRDVAWTLAGVSCGIWLLAAVVGRRLVRRALLPVTRMADAACSMTAADRDHRLPMPGTGDEFDALAGAFNGLLQRLHREVERQERFTGDASHQLRTPLAALLGQVEVALRRDRTAEEYRRALVDVHEEAVRLRQIVESLLFLRGPRARPGGPSSIRWSSPRSSASTCATGPATTARATCAWTWSPARAWVCAHPPLLGQLLDNLLDNAAKYSAPGTPIEVRALAIRRSRRAGRARIGAWASRPRTGRISSSPSTDRPRPGGAGSRASAWAWPWSAASPRRSAARSRSRASRDAGAPSRCGSPSRATRRSSRNARRRPSRCRWRGPEYATSLGPRRCGRARAGLSLSPDPATIDSDARGRAGGSLPARPPNG